MTADEHAAWSEESQRRDMSIQQAIASSALVRQGEAASMDVTLNEIRGVRETFHILGRHFQMFGRVTRHTVDDRAYAKGYSDAWLEASDYLRDLMIGQEKTGDEGDE